MSEHRLRPEWEEAVLVMSAATIARGQVEISGGRSLKHPEQEHIGLPLGVIAHVFAALPGGYDMKSIELFTVPCLPAQIHVQQPKRVSYVT